jgi:hypothetical protein
MPDPKRNELARILAAIDQLLADAESIAKDIKGDDRQRWPSFRRSGGTWKRS